MSHPLVAWIKQTPAMNTNTADINPTIVNDALGNIYVTYSTYGTVSGGEQSGNYDIVVFKMDNSGNMIWIKQHQTMNTNNNETNPVIALDSSMNVFVTYQTYGIVSGGTNIGSGDIVVFKLDTNGNFLWVKQQAVMNTSGNDQTFGIATDPSGNCYVSYYTDGTVSGGTTIGSNTLALFKLDADGNMVWIKDMSQVNGDNAYVLNPVLASDTTGNVFLAYVISGTVSGGTNAGGGYDIAVAKLDSNGNCVWIKQTPTMNTSGGDFYPSVALDASGNIYVGYWTTGAASGGSNVYGFDVIVFKLDSNGDAVWVKQPTSLNTNTGADYNIRIAADSSGNVYLSYRSSGTISGGTLRAPETVVVAKMDTNGNVVWAVQDGLINTNVANYDPAIAVDTNDNIFVTYYTNGTVSGGTNAGYESDIIVFKMIESSQQIVPSLASVTPSYYNNAAAFVSWLTKNGADSIKLYRDTQSSGATKTLLTTTSGLGYTDLPPSNGQYYYFISAMYGATETALSPSFSFNYTKPEYTLEWIKQTEQMQGTYGNNAFFGIFPVADSEGNLYVTYMVSGTISGGEQTGNPDLAVVKMDKNGTIIWMKQSNILNSTSNQNSPTMTIDSSGNLYITYMCSGTVSGGTNSGSEDIAVCKMDNNGNVMWVKQMPAFNSSSSELYPKIVVDAAGNSYVTFHSYGTISGGTQISPLNIAVFKLDANGNVVWSIQNALINADPYSYAPSIAISASGYLHIVYMTQGTVSGGTYIGGENIVVMKMNTNGNVVWMKQDPSFNTQQTSSPKIAVDASDNVFVTYYTNGTISGGVNTGGYDIVLFKLDSSGNIMWNKQANTFNTPSAEDYPCIAIDSADNVLLSYTSTGTVSGGTNFSAINAPVLCKFDTDGNIVWIKEEGILNVISSDQVQNTFRQVLIALDGSDALYVATTTSKTVSGGTQREANGYYPVVARYSAGPSVPSKPTAVTAAPGNGQAVVSFTAPGNDGGSAITNYTVTSSPGGFTASGASSPITVTGLTNGTAYTFTVRATNSLGQGQASVPSVAVTPAQPPSAPTGVTAVAESLRALVSWTKPTNDGGATITSYTVTSSPGGFTGSVNGMDNTSCYVYGLTNNTAYTFTVKAINIIGDSAASSPSSSVTPVADAPTTAVTNAVSSGNTVTITNYVNSATTTTDNDKTNLSIDMRTSLIAGTVGATTQQKVDTTLAYINSMRSKIGSDNFTVPQAKFTEYLQTYKVIAPETFVPKPFISYVPNFVGNSATIDITAVSSSNYIHFEVPIGYTLVIQNGANSISLTYNGTNYSDGTNTYNVGAIIVLGTKTLTLFGFGTLGSGVSEQSGAVVCIVKGSKIKTPSGDVLIESLAKGDMVTTDDGRIVPITKMRQIVVVSATKINAPYIIEKDAFGKSSPPNRMEVSPRHAIQLSPGLWEIPQEAAKENKLVYQNKDCIGKTVVYYHFSLLNYATDTTIVNGQATEVLNDGKCNESYHWNDSLKGYERKITNKSAKSISK